MNRLSPLPVRLIAYFVMVLIAIASIWFIDARAMQRQAELEQARQMSQRPADGWSDEPSDDDDHKKQK